MNVNLNFRGLPQARKTRSTKKTCSCADQTRQKTVQIVSLPDVDLRHRSNTHRSDWSSFPLISSKSLYQIMALVLNLCLWRNTSHEEKAKAINTLICFMTQIKSTNFQTEPTDCDINRSKRGRIFTSLKTCKINKSDILARHSMAINIWDSFDQMRGYTNAASQHAFPFVFK